MQFSMWSVWPRPRGASAPQASPASAGDPDLAAQSNTAAICDSPSSCLPPSSRATRSMAVADGASGLAQAACRVSSTVLSSGLKPAASMSARAATALAGRAVLVRALM
eukprot:5810-Heterococcus_DN1.PRE.2